MTTQHNLTVPRRKNPLQVRLTARISSLRHSTNWSLRWIFPLVDVFNLHTSSFFLNLHSTLFCTHSYRLCFHQTGYIGNPFGDAVLNLLLDLPPVDRVFLTAILVRYACTQDGTPACSLGYTSFVARFLAVAWLRNQMSRVLFDHSTIPRPNAFAVRLSRGLVMQLRVRQQAANNRSSGSVRRTGRSLRSGGAYDSRAARQGNQESDTQFTDRNNVTAYHVL